jgi:glucose-specific phosphotransferase system IIA component
MNRIEILSPFTGRVLPIEEVADPVFAEKMVGDGLAVEPTEGVGLAPVAGQLAVFHTAGHAFAVQVTPEVGVLVHVGLNTVQMKGQGFGRSAEKGDTVKAGQPVVKFDIPAINAAGYSPISPVILPDLPADYRIEKTTAKSVRAGQDVLMTLVRG